MEEGERDKMAATAERVKKRNLKNTTAAKKVDEFIGNARSWLMEKVERDAKSEGIITIQSRSYYYQSIMSKIHEWSSKLSSCVI